MEYMPEQVGICSRRHALEEVALDNPATVGDSIPSQELLRPSPHVPQIEQHSTQLWIALQHGCEQGPIAAADVGEDLDSAEVVCLEHRPSLITVKARHPGIEYGGQLG